MPGCNLVLPYVPTTVPLSGQAGGPPNSYTEAAHLLSADDVLWSGAISGCLNQLMEKEIMWAVY